MSAAPPPAAGGRRPVVGVLVADHVAAHLRDATGGADYGELYTRFLRSAEPSLATDVFDVVGGEVPDDPGRCDAWIITGSRHDAHGHEPWIHALCRLVVRLAAHRSRTVGICFGHQVLARALGGRVAPTGAWKVGPQRLDLELTPWFPGGRVHLNAMHRDAVAALPPGAREIGAGTTGRHPAFLVGDTMLGIQDHPELDATYTAALVEARRSAIGEDTARAALRALDEVATDGPLLARWIVDFLLDRRRS